MKPVRTSELLELYAGTATKFDVAVGSDNIAWIGALQDPVAGFRVELEAVPDDVEVTNLYLGAFPHPIAEDDAGAFVLSQRIPAGFNVGLAFDATANGRLVGVLEVLELPRYPAQYRPGWIRVHTPDGWVELEASQVRRVGPHATDAIGMRGGRSFPVLDTPLEHVSAALHLARAKRGAAGRWWVADDAGELEEVG